MSPPTIHASAASNRRDSRPLSGGGSSRDVSGGGALSIEGSGQFWWETASIAITAGTGVTERAVMSRVAAVAVALWWAVLFFGVIDLHVGIDPSQYPSFSQFVVVETSWGLLYSVLLPVPLIAWAAPARRVGGTAGRRGRRGGAGDRCGASGLGSDVVSLVVAASASFPRMWRPRPHWSMSRLGCMTPALWPVDALLAIGLGGAGCCTRGTSWRRHEAVSVTTTPGG